jgi:predicted phosphodiesterase
VYNAGIKGILIMKLHILSDIHIEFSNYILPIQEADVLVLAGDIGKGIAGVAYAAQYKKHYRHVVYVAGNHEFYGHHLSKTSMEIAAYAKECGVIFLDNNTVDIDGVCFVGSTLWTDFRLYGDKPDHIAFYMNMGQMQLNDFAQIRYGTFWFNPSDCAKMSVNSQKYIEDRLLENQGKKRVVVTHHCPSSKSISEKYKGSHINPCFANNLDSLVEKADLWIHGHTHDSFDYKLGDCRVICNPRGYSKYQDKQENVNFKPNLVVEI